jgi:hypothetical protein
VTSEERHFRSILRKQRGLSLREDFQALREKKRDGTRPKLKPQPQPKPTEDEELVETLKASIDKIAGKRKQLAA